MPGDALSRAFDRLDAFCAVQAAEHGRCTVEGVTLLQQAVGIGDDERGLIRERVAALGADPHVGAVLLGILVGTFAAEE